jgi:hypothetical protein
MVKENNSPIQRSTDTPRKDTQFPITLHCWRHKITKAKESNRCDPPLQRSVDTRRKVQHGKRSSCANFETTSTHVWNTLRNTYPDTPPVLTHHHSHRVRSSHIPEIVIDLHQWGKQPSNNLNRPRRRVSTIKSTTTESWNYLRRRKVSGS